MKVFGQGKPFYAKKRFDMTIIIFRSKPNVLLSDVHRSDMSNYFNENIPAKKMQLWVWLLQTSIHAIFSESRLARTTRFCPRLECATGPIARTPLRSIRPLHTDTRVPRRRSIPFNSERINHSSAPIRMLCLLLSIWVSLNRSGPIKSHIMSNFEGIITTYIYLSAFNMTISSPKINDMWKNTRFYSSFPSFRKNILYSSSYFWNIVSSSSLW